MGGDQKRPSFKEEQRSLWDVGDAEARMLKQIPAKIRKGGGGGERVEGEVGKTRDPVTHRRPSSDRLRARILYRCTYRFCYAHAMDHM